VATLERWGVTVRRHRFPGNAQPLWRHKQAQDVGYKPRNEQQNPAQRSASSVGLQHRGPVGKGYSNASDVMLQAWLTPVRQPAMRPTAIFRQKTGAIPHRYEHRRFHEQQCRGSGHFATFIGISLVNRGWRRLPDRLSFREAQLSGAEPMDWRG
jgi:hypothetical protein